MFVRRISPSLAISVGVHALIAVLWGVVELELDPAEREPGPSAIIELVDPEPDVQSDTAVEVVMLDLATLETMPVLKPEVARREPVATTPPRGVDRPIPAPAIRKATTASREPAVAEPVATTTRSSYLDLRKGRDLEGRGRDALRLSTPSLERIALGPESTRSVVDTTGATAIVDAKPRESIVTAEITPGGRGTYKIDDLVFKGRIARDGSVSIKDKANVQHQFKSWKHIKHVLRTAGPFGLLQLDFDITDALMRKKKMDPYASRKLAFLDQTRDARVELGRQYRKEVLARTSEIVRGNLELMWATVTDAAARKTALFDLWDEVDEAGDEEVVAAGTAARATVIGFLRARFPSSSATAYTASEIAALNGKRKSRAVFAPYE